ncbi:MAG: molybdate ABC transporter substrate-binding protein [Armatimonadota bacterium]
MKLWTVTVIVACLTIFVVGCGTRNTATTTAPPALQDAPAQPSSASSPPGSTLTGTLTVGVPCGLAMSYKELRDLFRKRHPGVKIVDHISNIGPMTKEVRDRKVPLDVFLSLGELEIAALSNAGRVAGKPTPYLRQAMQLCVQKGNPLGIKTLDDLALPEVETVALCVPSLTLGHAADEALKTVGLLEKLEREGKIVRVDQPMQAKGFVFSRKVDAAFIYGACSNEAWAARDPERSVVGKADVVLTVPEASYGGMFAVAAVLKSSRNPDLAQKFVDFLLTPEAQEAIAKAGYGKMDDAAPKQ